MIANQLFYYREEKPPFSLRIKTILYDVIGNPSPEKFLQVERLYDQYNHKFVVAYDSDLGEVSVTGIIGLEFMEKCVATIKHLGVHESMRKKGIGKLLLQYITSNYSLMHIKVETDADAVNFYKKCGFKVQSIIKQHGQRYQCMWMK